MKINKKAEKEILLPLSLEPPIVEIYKEESYCVFPFAQKNPIPSRKKQNKLQYTKLTKETSKSTKVLIKEKNINDKFTSALKVYSKQNNRRNMIIGRNKSTHSMNINISNKKPTEVNHSFVCKF